MVAKVSLKARAYRWMGEKAIKYPNLTKAIRVAVPFVSGAIGAAVDLGLSYGVPRESLAVTVPAFTVFGEVVRGRIANGIQAEATGNEKMSQLEKRLNNSQEYVSFLSSEIEALRQKAGAPVEAGVRYEKVEELGRGAQAIVLLVIDRAVRQPRVLKVPALSEAVRYFRGALGKFLERFKSEAANLSLLDNPHIVKIFHYDELDLETYMQITGEKIDPKDTEGFEKFPYILMEYVKGENLGDKLREEARKGYQGFPLSYAVKIMLDLMSALEEMDKKNVIHRDFKTENIVITPGGEIKVIDFGIARGLQGTGTVLGSPMGSPGYMSPEQMGSTVLPLLEQRVGRKIEITSKSDLFGAGATFWELLTGSMPFEDLERFADILNRPVPQIQNKVHEISDRLAMDLDVLLEGMDPMSQNEELRQFKMDLQVQRLQLLGTLQRIFNKTLALDPAKRYKDIEELHTDLARVLAENNKYQQDLDRFLRSSSTAFAATVVKNIPGPGEEE